MNRRAPLLAILWLLVPALPAAGDLLPSRPLSLWNDRLVVSGEATITIGSHDEGYFNALDYSHDAFNLLTLSLSAELRALERVWVLGQVVDETALRTRDFGPTDRHVLRPYAFYVRVQPLEGRPLHVQAGRIPPVFGAFVRQEYGTANPLIGLPLAYHYPTIVRPDVLPPGVGELMANRGSGWLVRYPRDAAGGGQQGVPLVSARRWDTGVQVRWAGGPIEIGAAVTNGTLSDPLTRDDNGGKQVSARIGWQPVPAFALGGSIARGAFGSDRARDPLGGRDVRQRQDTWGIDGEYSRGYVLVRGEVIASRWDQPFANGEPPRRLGALAGWLETRVKLAPRWSVAVRGDRLTFSRLDVPGMGDYAGVDGESYAASSADGPGWDAPVTRVEAGASYLVRRNVRVKASYQYNWRDGGRLRQDGLLGVQLAYWF